MRSNTFSLVLSLQAKEDFLRFNAQTKAILASWLKKNLDNCVNPRLLGSELKKYDFNHWIYRFGRFKLFALIESDRIVILKIQG